MSALPALAMAATVYPGIINSIHAGYADDTFFHLPTRARFGLATLAFIAASSLLFLSIRKSEFLHRLMVQRLFERANNCIVQGIVLLIDLSLSALLFMFGMSLAPQLFYTYYQTIFPSLPAQWVIERAWQLDVWQQRILLQPGDSMADQAIALLFWTLLYACVISAVLRNR